MSPTEYFIEDLTLRTLFFSLAPRLIRGRMRFQHRAARCHVIDGDRLTVRLAKLIAWVAGVEVRRLKFRISDLRDADGQSVRLQISYRDLAKVRQDALAELGLCELVENGKLKDRLPAFIAKRTTLADTDDQMGLWRVLSLVHVCASMSEGERARSGMPVLILKRRPWPKTITRYASEQGLAIVPVRSGSDLRAALKKRLPLQVLDTLRVIYHRPSNTGRVASIRRWAASRNQTRGSKPDAGANIRPLVAVDYYGHLNLNQPERNSDLFFYQRSSLPAKDVLLAFSIPKDPIDLRKIGELREHGIGAVALHPGATVIPGVPIFVRSQKPRHLKRSEPRFDRKDLNGAWLNDQIGKYTELRTYWEELAQMFNIKVYTTWFKYDATHCAISDALRATGGVTAMYQRAYEFHPSAETTIDTDIEFGFSRAGSEVARLSCSSIRYHVTTGYLGDHRFTLLADGAQRVRATLQENGARRIMAFFDENSSPDERWHTGHHVPQGHYAYILEKVLANPWFGLVIKPKSVANLRERLGPVAQILDEAESTGRCYLYQGRHNESFHGWDPPAAAALAADVAVHGYVASATAGIEAALAGIPTLMMDREGWDRSPIYRLGREKVVFTDWDRLWEACEQHWSASDGVRGFGDWTPMLDELDPFRDGRAAERMGTYIQWLLEGFQDGLDRETVMADAAERYCAAWGKDKIAAVNSGWQNSPPPVAGERGTAIGSAVHR